MINRYQGNSGKFTRIEERRELKRPHEGAAPPRVSGSGEYRQELRPHPQNRRGGVFEKLTKLISGGGSQLSQFSQLETEDLILLLILYLMYRESGDSELLMIMGAMFLT